MGCNVGIRVQARECSVCEKENKITLQEAGVSLATEGVGDGCTVNRFSAYGKHEVESNFLFAVAMVL